MNFPENDKCSDDIGLLDQNSSLQRRTLISGNKEFMFFIYAFQFINRLLNENNEPSFRQAVRASSFTNHEGIVDWSNLPHLDVNPRTRGLRYYVEGVQHTFEAITRALNSENFQQSMCRQLAQLYSQSLQICSLREIQYQRNRLRLPDNNRCRMDHSDILK